MFREIKNITLLLAFSLCVSLSCSKDENFSYKRSDNTSAVTTKTVSATVKDRSVMLLYSAGFNDLCGYLEDDIEELSQGFVPREGMEDNLEGNRAGGTQENVLLVFSRIAYGIRNTTPVKSALFRIYRKADDTVVRDTIKVWEADVHSCSKETMSEVLTLAHEKFPSNRFGMVFSSHASGWLPCGYYSDPSKYYNGSSGDIWSTFSLKRGTDYFPPLEDFPAVKSIGQDKYATMSVEFTLKDFADAIPFKLDYLLIDACLSGGVEVAAQLRGKADIVGFSLTEVLADGFNYKTIVSRLLSAKPDPVAVCRDYYESYIVRSGYQQSATISVVDTREMDDLISLCRTLFEKYRISINNLNGFSVQGYFRYNRHYFYDLEDILVKAGITADEKAALDKALSKCVVYCAATPWFMHGYTDNFEIKTFCGLSMYLPSQLILSSAERAYLDSYYKANIAWNTETELVK